MLHSYPETLLDYAVDGVIQAASRHRADRAERLLDFAHRQAIQGRDQAALEATAVRATAACEGYRDGLLQAMTSVLPIVQSLRQEQIALQSRLREDMITALAAMEGSASVAVAQLEQLLAGPVAALPPLQGIVLHVPEQHPGLLQSLRDAPALQGLTLQPANRAHLLLEVGSVAFELDSASVLAEALDSALNRQMPQLQQAMSLLADRYEEALQQRMQQEAQHAGLRRIKEQA